MWLYSLMCIAALPADCGYSDRVLTPLEITRSHTECLLEATKFAHKMKVSPDKWVIVCYESSKIKS